MSDESEQDGIKNTEIHSSKLKSKPFDGVYHAPLDKLGPPGRWIRHQLLNAILVGTPVLVIIQKYRKPWLDVLMHILSFMGTEDFYTIIVVILAWVVDVRFARLFTILMGIGFYCATSLKNIIRLPRPPVPPVQVLENALDWALPSLHSVIGVVLPWYIWCYSYLHFHLSFTTLILLFFIIAFWSKSVMVSRVYLGVHSPADIVSGGIIGVIILSFYLQIDGAIDYFISYSKRDTLVIPQMFLYYALLLAIHPKSDPPTASYSETVITNGVAFGMIIGQRRTVGYHAHYYSALLEHSDGLDSVTMLFAISIGRILLGFPIVMLIRVVCKAILKPSVIALCKLGQIPWYSLTQYQKNTVSLCKHYCKGFKLPPIYKAKAKEERKGGTKEEDSTVEKEESSTEEACENVSMPFNIDTPLRFITYCCMTWGATEFIPHLFHALHLVTSK